MQLIEYDEARTHQQHSAGEADSREQQGENVIHVTAICNINMTCNNHARIITDNMK